MAVGGSGINAGSQTPSNIFSFFFAYSATQILALNFEDK